MEASRAHLGQRLTSRRQGLVVGCGNLKVVKSNHEGNHRIFVGVVLGPTLKRNWYVLSALCGPSSN